MPRSKPLPLPALPATRLDALTLGITGISLCLWSSAFAGIRAGLVAYEPGQLALLRYLVAAAVLAAYALLTRMPIPERRDWPALAGLGLLGVTTYHLALSYGQITIQAGSASLLIAAAPICAALIAVIKLGERLRIWGWVGIGISFAGVALIALGEGEGLHFAPGAWLVLLAALSASLYLVLQKPYLRRYTPLQITAYAAWLGLLPMLVFLPGLLVTLPSAPLSATLPIVYLGIGPTAIAYTGWGFVLSRIPASIAASFLYLQPPLAIAIAWIWLREVPSLLSLWGGVQALIGVVVVNRWGRSS